MSLFRANRFLCTFEVQIADNQKKSRQSGGKEYIARFTAGLRTLFVIRTFGLDGTVSVMDCPREVRLAFLSCGFRNWDVDHRRSFVFCARRSSRAVSAVLGTTEDFEWTCMGGCRSQQS